MSENVVQISRPRRGLTLRRRFQFALNELQTKLQDASAAGKGITFRHLLESQVEVEDNYINVIDPFQYCVSCPDKTTFVQKWNKLLTSFKKTYAKTTVECERIEKTNGHATEAKSVEFTRGVYQPGFQWPLLQINRFPAMVHVTGTSTDPVWIHAGSTSAPAEHVKVAHGEECTAIQLANLDGIIIGGLKLASNVSDAIKSTPLAVTDGPAMRSDVHLLARAYRQIEVQYRAVPRAAVRLAAAPGIRYTLGPSHGPIKVWRPTSAFGSWRKRTLVWVNEKETTDGVHCVGAYLALMFDLCKIAGSTWRLDRDSGYVEKQDLSGGKAHFSVVPSGGYALFTPKQLLQLYPAWSRPPASSYIVPSDDVHVYSSSEDKLAVYAYLCSKVSWHTDSAHDVVFPGSAANHVLPIYVHVTVRSANFLEKETIHVLGVKADADTCSKISKSATVYRWPEHSTIGISPFQNQCLLEISANSNLLCTAWPLSNPHLTLARVFCTSAINTLRDPPTAVVPAAPVATPHWVPTTLTLEAAQLIDTNAKSRFQRLLLLQDRKRMRAALPKGTETYCNSGNLHFVFYPSGVFTPLMHDILKSHTTCVGIVREGLLAATTLDGASLEFDGNVKGWIDEQETIRNDTYSEFPGSNSTRAWDNKPYNLPYETRTLPYETPYAGDTPHRGLYMRVITGACTRKNPVAAESECPVVHKLANRDATADVHCYIRTLRAALTGAFKSLQLVDHLQFIIVTPVGTDERINEAHHNLIRPLFHRIVERVAREVFDNNAKFTIWIPLHYTKSNGSVTRIVSCMEEVAVHREGTSTDPKTHSFKDVRPFMGSSPLPGGFVEHLIDTAGIDMSKASGGAKADAEAEAEADAEVDAEVEAAAAVAAKAKGVAAAAAAAKAQAEEQAEELAKGEAAAAVAAEELAKAEAAAAVAAQEQAEAAEKAAAEKAAPKRKTLGASSKAQKEINTQLAGSIKEVTTAFDAWNPAGPEVNTVELQKLLIRKLAVYQKLSKHEKAKLFVAQLETKQKLMQQKIAEMVQGWNALMEDKKEAIGEIYTRITSLTLPEYDKMSSKKKTIEGLHLQVEEIITDKLYDWVTTYWGHPTDRSSPWLQMLPEVWTLLQEAAAEKAAPKRAASDAQENRVRGLIKDIKTRHTEFETSFRNLSRDNAGSLRAMLDATKTILADLQKRYNTLIAARTEWRENNNGAIEDLLKGFETAINKGDEELTDAAEAVASAIDKQKEAEEKVIKELHTLLEGYKTNYTISSNSPGAVDAGRKILNDARSASAAAWEPWQLLANTRPKGYNGTDAAFVAGLDQFTTFINKCDNELIAKAQDKREADFFDALSTSYSSALQNVRDFSLDLLNTTADLPLDTAKSTLDDFLKRWDILKKKRPEGYSRKRLIEELIAPYTRFITDKVAEVNNAQDAKERAFGQRLAAALKTFKNDYSNSATTDASSAIFDNAKTYLNELPKRLLDLKKTRLKSYLVKFDGMVQTNVTLLEEFLNEFENDLIESAAAADADMKRAKQTKRAADVTRVTDAQAVKAKETAAVNKQLDTIYDKLEILGKRLYSKHCTVAAMKKVADDVQAAKVNWNATRRKLGEAMGFANHLSDIKVKIRVNDIITSIETYSNQLAVYWKEKRDEVQGSFDNISNGVASASNLDDLTQRKDALDAVQSEWAIIEPELPGTDSTVTPIEGVDSLSTQIITLKEIVLHKDILLEGLKLLKDCDIVTSSRHDLHRHKDELKQLKQKWEEMREKSDKTCNDVIDTEFKAIYNSFDVSPPVPVPAPVPVTTPARVRVLPVTPPATPPVISTVTPPARVLPVTPTAAVTGAPTWVHETDDFVFTNDILSAVGDAFGN